MRPTPLWTEVLAAVAILMVSSDGRAQARPSLPAQVFRTVEHIELYEDTAVINVAPFVFPLSAGGGFFIVDQREARARIYDADGALVTQFGRRGRGPGEFFRPIAGYQLRSGRKVVADLGNGVLVFDAANSLLAAERPAITPIYSVLPLSKSTALLVGRLRDPDSGAAPPLLHIWSLTQERILHSFFTTPGSTAIRHAARNFGWAGAAIRADTIAAVFALTDTAYLFTNDGELLERLPLPIDGFTPIRDLPSDQLNNPLERVEWLGRFYFLHTIYWLPDGTFLVQYERPRRVDSEWNLIHVSRTGERLFDLKNTPRLLTVDGDRLYFVDPQSLTPDKWIATRIRPGH